MDGKQEKSHHGSTRISAEYLYELVSILYIGGCGWATIRWLNENEEMWERLGQENRNITRFNTGTKEVLEVADEARVKEQRKAEA